MNSKSILIAAVITVGLGGAGYFAKSAGSGNANAAASAGEAVLPGLFESINDVSEIVVSSLDFEFHVKRQAETWVLVEKSGYPVQVGSVRSTLIALAELKTVEEKTSNANSYSKLGVQSVGAEPLAENQPKKVELLDVNGEAIASLIIGKDRAGGKGGTFYVRRPTEVATWLVEGRNPGLPDSGDDWLNKQVLEIERADIKAVRTVHVDGEELTLSKEDADANFNVHNMPEDRELSYAAVADSIAGALQYVNFEDVQKADEFDASEAPISVVHFWTKDGIRLTVKCWEKEEKIFAAFEANYDAAGAPSLALGPVPAPAEGEAQAKSTPRPEAEMQGEIGALNERLSPWIFELPAYSKTNFTRRIDGLLKPLPEPVEESAAPADPDAPLDIDNLGGQ
jgi:hypothetical protein